MGRGTQRRAQGESLRIDNRKWKEALYRALR